eukprot:TRINITY_DN67574_c0_g1_i1.p1 TRINITY_DN67574_c0_g1~~TRINITY_DN67574_c0_g1_i1.p1  ORF type:complete len:466 (+),score=65.25 TRINITY_DN67574_c0_g1_i1:109-1506(+)
MTDPASLLGAAQSDLSVYASHVCCSSGFGGMPFARIRSPDGAVCDVYFNGAHVVAWTPTPSEPDGKEADRLFISSQAKFVPGGAIRGGVPICWPQFSDLAGTPPAAAGTPDTASSLRKLPQHGFLRNATWRPVSARVGATGDGEGCGTAVTFAVAALEPSPSSAAPDADTPGGPFTGVSIGGTTVVDARWAAYQVDAVRYTVEVRRRVLVCTLQAANPSATPVRFTAALHSYLRAPVATATVVGLGAQSPFLNNLANRALVPARHAPTDASEGTTAAAAADVASGDVGSGAVPASAAAALTAAAPESDGVTGPLAGEVDRIYVRAARHSRRLLPADSIRPAAEKEAGAAEAPAGDGDAEDAHTIGGFSCVDATAAEHEVGEYRIAYGKGGGGIAPPVDGGGLRVVTRGLPDAVLWNPWIARARAIADLGDVDYTRFLCLEPASAATQIELRPGAVWRGRMELHAE